MSDPPYLIPRRLVFRMAASILFGEADRLNRLADPRNHRRRGHDAVTAAAEVAESRAAIADELQRDAVVLMKFAQGDGPEVKGPGVDPACVGHLMAVVSSRGESYAELRAEIKDWLGKDPLPEQLNAFCWSGNHGRKAALVLLVATLNDRPEEWETSA